MNQDVPRTRVRVVGGAAIAALPFAFGTARALHTGSDVRYLVMASSSLVAAAVMTWLGVRRRLSAWVLWSLTLAGSTAVSAAVASGLGATSAVAVLTVAVAFSACTATGMVLALHRRR